MNYLGPELAGFFLLFKPVREDDDLVAFFAEPGGGSAQGDLAFFADDRVSFKAVAVVEVEHVDLFAGRQAGGLEQLFVNGDTAFVIEKGVGHGRHVDL